MWLPRASPAKRIAERAGALLDVVVGIAHAEERETGDLGCLVDAGIEGEQPTSEPEDIGRGGGLQGQTAPWCGRSGPGLVDFWRSQSLVNRSAGILCTVWTLYSIVIKPL